MEGILSHSVNGQAKAESGAMEFCLTLNATSLKFDISAAGGERLAIDLNIQDLPAALLSNAALLFLLLPLLIALHYFVKLRTTEGITLGTFPDLTLLALLLFLMLVQTAQAFTIESLLGGLGSVFKTLAWQSFGLVLAGLVFIPLVFEYCSQSIQQKLRADVLVVGVFVAFVLLLYLPFGLDSIGQKEEWINRAFLAGRPSRTSGEVLMRFFRVFRVSICRNA